MLGNVIKSTVGRAPRPSLAVLSRGTRIATSNRVTASTSTWTQQRCLNTVDRTPRLVEKHKLGSVPSPAEQVGEPAREPKRGKLWDSADDAVKDLKSGSTILSAGTFGWLSSRLIFLSSPEKLINSLHCSVSLYQSAQPVHVSSVPSSSSSFP